MKKKKGQTDETHSEEAGSAVTDDTSGSAQSTRELQCCVVGMGASAGGLDAFARFFDAMPAESGMAFVLIQHLDPTHESLTAELLGRHTTMSVAEVTADVRVEPDHVYVIPPNKYLAIDDGVLRLSVPVTQRGMRMPIDFFLRSLAREYRERGIGVILSGTGTDGTLGLKELKAAGGLAVVQDPSTALHDGMPRSAIASGSVDSVLALEKMPEALVAYVSQGEPASEAHESRARGRTKGELADVLAVLRARAAFDFGCYRKATVERRIYRRMRLRHAATIAEYVHLLRGDPVEVRQVFKDLLISVSSFFREPEAWKVLEAGVVAPLFASKHSEDPIRVWIPGCATGEEAYSLAMLLIEGRQAAQRTCPLQIFASDVDAEALEVARTGVYPESIAADVSPERLRRFFLKGDDSHYRVNKELRESVIFAEQNLVADPPFSKLDLISCTNLLIYLEGEVQKKLMSLFHFALVENGHLFLGSAETVGQADDLFEPVSKKWRIFRRIGPTRRDRVYFPVSTMPERAVEQRGGGQAGVKTERLPAVIQQRLLDQYAPASVVITRKYEILYYSGPTENYLVQPSGAPTSDLFAKAREGLHAKLRGAVHRAVGEEQRITLTGVRVRRNGDFRPTRVTVEPLKTPREVEGLLLVCFEDEPQTAVAVPEPSAARAAGGEEWLVRQLEHELKTTRDDLQSTIEELETSNEELKAANEEVMSVNEELQSTNEELETSKEELQSLNEELSTMNVQLQTKVTELERTTNDLDNLLTSTNIATLFLDCALRIRRFTPAATKLFKLITTDIGRPIADIAPRFTDPDLFQQAERVLQNFTPAQREVRAEDGRWYVRQILPYRTQDSRIDGVVVTFSDVATEALQEARDYAETIVETMYDALVVLSADLRVMSVNRAFCELFRVSKEETINRPFFAVGESSWDHPALRTLLRSVAEGERDAVEVEIEGDFAKIGQTILRINAGLLERSGAADPPLILLAMRDITARKQGERALRDSEARLQSVVDTAPEAVVILDDAGIIETLNASAEALFGHGSEEVVGRNIEGLLPALGDGKPRGKGRRVSRAGLSMVAGQHRETILRRDDGTTVPVELGLGEFSHDGQHKFTLLLHDITQRRRSEKREEQHRAELARTLRITSLGEFAAGLAHQLNQPLAAIANGLEACASYVRAGDGSKGRLLRLLGRATDEAIHAGNIVNHLREFLQHHRSQRRATDFDGLVQGALELLRPSLDAQQIRVRRVSSGGPLVVAVDPIEIEQVVLNLVHNAIEAIQAVDVGARELTVKTTVGSDRKTARLAISDSGPGLSAEAAKRLFEPFFTTKESGLGMGLNISRSIVESAGGSIALKNRRGRSSGTTAEVVLPLAKPTGGGTPESKSKSKSKSKSGREG